MRNRCQSVRSSEGGRTRTVNVIMKEETLAWEVGRELLADLGYEGLDKFDAQSAQGLHHHRVRLGLEPFAPENCAMCSDEVQMA